MPVLFSLLLFLTMIARSVLVGGETTKVCHNASGICFQQFSNSETRSSVGIVLPPLQNVDADATADPFQQDILVNLTTTFPYGFAGIGRSFRSLNEPKLLGPLINAYMTFSSEASPIGSFQTAMIGQYSDFASTNRTHLVPIMGASILFSNLSRWDEHSDITPDGRASLNLFRSEIKPIYPTPTALNATLLTSNVAIASFEVHVDDLRSQEYHNYLLAANLLKWF